MSSEAITRNDLTAILNEVLPLGTDPIILIHSKTFNFMGTTYMIFDVPVHDGYTCVGVIGWAAGGVTSATNDMFDYNVDIGNQKLHVSNNTTTASSYSVRANLLYVKNGKWQEYTN